MRKKQYKFLLAFIIVLTGTLVCFLGCNSLQQNTNTSALQVTDILPSVGYYTDSLKSVQIFGANFDNSIDIYLVSGNDSIKATNVSVQTSSSLLCDFSLVGISIGYCDLKVVKGTETAIKEDAFKINAGSGASVSDIEPKWGINDEVLKVTVTGNNFQQDSTVKFEKGSSSIDAYAVNVENGSKLSCIVDLNDLAIGSWYVVVQSPNYNPSSYSTGNIHQKIMVKRRTTISSISPSNGAITDSNCAVTISGSNFTSSPTSIKLIAGNYSSSATGINVNPTYDEITCSFDLTNMPISYCDLVIDFADLTADCSDVTKDAIFRVYYYEIAKITITGGIPGGGGGFI